MDDLISRQAVLEMLNDINDHIRDGVGFRYDWCVEWVKGLQSAQPEIIHCCECKWIQCNMRLDGYLPKGVPEFECRHWCGEVDPTDFCSYGAKMEVEHAD